MSKLSKLKQEAYLAGKKRNWDEAISAYERILEIDRSNPATLNEMGDLCLRRGETARAMSHFLSAAAGYRSSGLQNNAVAVYKKILRHDERNLTAHWSLAEVRVGQGFLAEGEQHALRFLSAAETIGSDGRDVFQKRLVQLLALYPASGEILARLDDVFRKWSLPLEGARVACLVACREWDGGRSEEAQRRMTVMQEEHPEIVHYPEHAAWRRRVSPDSEPVADYADLNEVKLGDLAAPAPEVAPASAAVPAPVISGADDLALSCQARHEQPHEAPVGRPVAGARPSSALAAALAVAEPEAETGIEPEPAAPAAEDRDEEGCFEIDEQESIGGVLQELQRLASAPAASVAADPSSAPVTSGAGVDLLAEILADDGHDLQASADSQLRTIASEIGQQAGEDPESRYEMGLVYLEMGLFDQAAECFEAAAADARFTLRSLEMWGISLVRQHRHDDAVAVFGRGLEAAAPEPDKLALLYHAGRAHEEAGRPAEALTCYRRAHAIQAGFLDLEQRLARLS